MAQKLELVEENEIMAYPEKEVLDNGLLFFRKMHEMRKLIAGKELTMDGYNSHQKYEYVPAWHYKQVLNEACMECGMENYVAMKGAETILLPNDDSKQHLTRISADIVLVDLDTGFSVGFPMIADGCDSLDKGIYKADTMLIKAFVQTTFLRHDKDDLDVESINSNAKKPMVFTTKESRRTMKDQLVSSGEKATEEIMDKIYNGVVALRGVDPNFMQNGELDKFNTEALTQVEAVTLLLNIEESADEMGVEL